MRETTDYFPALTGIRAIAAFMVFIHHFNPGKNYSYFLEGFFNELHVGVTLFFVLSGFLIAFRYYNIFNISWKWVFDYLLKRLARIYPMYFLLTLFVFFVLAWSSDIGFTQYVMQQYKVLILNLSFLRGFFNDYKFSLIAQGWSLTVEECFYFAAPIIFFAIRKFKPFIILIPILLILTGLLLVLLFKDIPFYGFFNSYFFLFSYTFFGRCFEFFVGIALALYLIRQNENQISKPFILSFATYSGLVLLLISIWGMSVLKVKYELGLYTTQGRLINNVIIPVFISIFFLGLITEKTWIRIILETSIFQILGKSSYIFYLIHLGIIQSYLSNYAGHNIAISFIILNFIAIMLYYIIENPLNNKIRSLKYPLFNLVKIK
jgi:peptidoglycan/LPS O-acetylase OafA/YrhL